MRNDERRIIQIAGKDNAPNLGQVQDAIRQLCSMVYTLEGRSGEISLRDALRITGDQGTNGISSIILTLISNLLPGLQFQVIGYTYQGTNRTYLVSGAHLVDAAWQADATAAVIISLTLDGTPAMNVYANASLTIGQFFIPTLRLGVSSSGTVTVTTLATTTVTATTLTATTLTATTLTATYVNGVQMKGVFYDGLQTSGENGNTGAGETTLSSYTFTLPILVPGDRFVLRGVAFLPTTNAGTKTLRVKIGGATSATIFATTSTTVNQLNVFDVIIDERTTTTSAFSGVTSIGASGAALVTTYLTNGAISSCDFTVAQTILITGQASNTNDLIMTDFTALLYPGGVENAS